MPNSVYPNDRTGAARAFVEHLRRFPEEARGDPAALAARFGLEIDFVRRALARLPSLERHETPQGPSAFARQADGVVAVLDRLIERASVNPIRFEVVTLVLVIAILTLGSWLVPVSSNPTVSSLKLAGSVALMLVTVAAQMAVFYRRRMTRYALVGGLGFGLILAFVSMALVWVGQQRTPASEDQMREGAVVLAVGLAMMVLGGLYAGLAALVSLAGGWIHLRRADEEWERLSRQELLERYFDLQRRLEHSIASPDVPQTWETWPMVAAVRRNPPLAAASLGFVLGVLDLLTSLIFGSGAQTDLGGSVSLALWIVEMLVTFTLLATTCFLAGRATRGAIAGATFTLGMFIASFVPLGDGGLANALDPSRVTISLGGLAFATFVGALAGVGATIQRRTIREGRLARNDGATLVAEMLEIQWRLEEDATRVTVLVVDAAKSTAMKVGADPLDVEYSFREYQMWIAEVCAGFGGRIHSVAGDGAVVAFSEGAAAMDAARRLQTDVVRFNAETNRLPKPFRLRLGLHAGRVAGDLNDVQFTEVIDIAAHVETIAPVGGIAATGAVVEGLGEEGFLPLSRDVDGQPVWIALVPTEG